MKMAKEKTSRLGTGLSALFGEEENVLENETVQTLPISRVEPRKDQPRREFDPAAIEELAESIREYGLIQPITVRPLDKGYYQIIAGERRWRASRAAGLKEVPVRILEADDKLAMELALVENLQREDLNPMEEAAGYTKLMDDYGLTQEQVASRVQKSRPAVTNALRLLSLGETLQKKVSAASSCIFSSRMGISARACPAESCPSSTSESTAGVRLSRRSAFATAGRDFPTEDAASSCVSP